MEKKNEIFRLQKKLDSLIDRYNSSNLSLTSTVYSYKDTNPAVGNVYVSEMKQPEYKYLGCTEINEPRFNDGDHLYNKLSMEDCVQRAVRDGSNVFRYSNGKCITSSIVPELKSKKYESFVIWQLNSPVTPCTMILHQCNIVLLDMNGDVQISSDTAASTCFETEGINSLRATYGGTCPGIHLGNATQAMQELVQSPENNNLSQITYTIGSNMEDPSPKCKKPFDITYRCGKTPKVKHVPGESFGQNIILDCSNSIGKCDCTLYLTEDGNMEIQRVSDKSILYSFDTRSKVKDANPHRIASLGKKGVPFIRNNDGLKMDEWLSNEVGTITLSLTKQGELILHGWKEIDLCIKEETTGEMVGNEKANSMAVYSFLPGTVSKEFNYGKMGYVDDNSILHEYPTTMIQNGSSYLKKSNTNIDGPTSKVITDSSSKECASKCNSTEDCTGYTFNNIQNLCLIKTDNLFADRLMDDGTDLYIRKPTVDAPFCTGEFKDITSVEWEDFIQSDIQMTPEYKCGLYKDIIPDVEENEKLLTELQDTANELNAKMMEIQNSTQSIKQEINLNSNKIQESLLKYQNIIQTREGMVNQRRKASPSFLNSTHILLNMNATYYIFFFTIAIIVFIICIIMFFN